MQSLLTHLHCLGNAGLQKYMFGIKKKKKKGCKWFRSSVWNVFASEGLEPFRGVEDEASV